MKYVITALLLWAYCANAQSASDTTFFDKNWKRCFRDTSSFYRLVRKEGDAYKVTDYYASGKLQMTGTFSSPDTPQIRIGQFIYYYESGTKSSEAEYSNGKLNGVQKTYYDTTGIPFRYTEYQNGLSNGTYRKYYPDGKKWREEEYEDGKMVKGSLFNAEGKKMKFYPEQVIALFKGGELAMAEYIKKTLIYPEYARENGIEGRVFVKFYVDSNGIVKDVTVYKSDNRVLDDAATNVIKRMPHWTPGKIENKKSGTFFILPVRFRLQG